MREFFATASAVVGLVVLSIGLAFAFAGLVLVLAITPRVIGLLFANLGVTLAAFGTLPLLYRRIAMRGRRQLLETGVETTATILGMRENRSVRVNRSHPWIVEYEYATFGEKQRGRETMFEVPPGYAVGATVAAKFDRSHLHRSALVR